MESSQFSPMFFIMEYIPKIFGFIIKLNNFPNNNGIISIFSHWTYRNPNLKYVKFTRETDIFYLPLWIAHLSLIEYTYLVTLTNNVHRIQQIHKSGDAKNFLRKKERCSVCLKTIRWVFISPSNRVGNRAPTMHFRNKKRMHWGNQNYNEILLMNPFNEWQRKEDE